MRHLILALALPLFFVAPSFAEEEQKGCNLITNIPPRALKFFGTKELPGSGLGRYYDDYLWHVNGPVYCRLQTTPFDKTQPPADCEFGADQVRDCQERAPTAPRQWRPNRL